MARWRWLFVIVLISGSIVFPPGGINTAPAQSAPSGSQILASSGTPGSFTAATSVGQCHYSRPDGILEAAITIPAPIVSPQAGMPNQRIEWEPRLYQGLPGIPARELLQQELPQSRAASGSTVTFEKARLSGFPHGSAYVTGGLITWFSNNSEIGSIEFIFTKHDSFTETLVRQGQSLKNCTQVAPTEINLSTYRTTVNVTVRITGRYFPISVPVNVTLNGKTIAQAMSDANGAVATSIKVPATPLGEYRLALDAGSMWKPHASFTVVPRIKVIPDQADRGDTVKISLRGFAKKEVVRIRWIRDGKWVEIGRITTSNTGSGELWIPVPAWATDGGNSVRGDGPIARAQTNAFTVTGGPGISLSSEESTPSPGTPEPIIDPVPATPAPEETPPPAESETPDAAGTPSGGDAQIAPEFAAPATPNP